MLFDPGLQPERTALAWRRTGLALTAGSLVAVRILPAVLGSWALVPAGFGVIAALSILVLAHRRHVRIAHTLLTTDGHRVPLQSGMLLFAVFVVTVGGGVAALMVIAAQLA